MDRVEELHLVQAAQRGDSAAFETLYRENVQRVFRYVYYRVNDRHLAEDLTGDVFTRALASISRYEDRGRPFIAWLYRIANGRVIDHYRRVGRRPREHNVDLTPLPVQQDMDSALVRQQVARVLRAAIAELTAEQQQVIILRFIEDKRIDEAAAIMGKNPNAIKALQHRALRTLAARLQRAGFPIDDILAGLSS
ncbi:MAG: RNA polymerase sigma factor [Phototrophicaceae bacterium]